ncbi:hypothetical protein QEN19_003047 [Hanseniaspora menglaensis]
MSKLGYLASYYMPLFCSSRYVTVITTIFSITCIYIAFFLSSNFLQSSYIDSHIDNNKSHLFVPNEQDYFRTCLLGIFSPLFFNFLKNFVFNFPVKNPVVRVISNVFVDYCIYDWFLFLIIYFLAYPQLDTTSNNEKKEPKIGNEIEEYVRNVFHIIPKQSYILAICWSLSECMLSILENLSFFQEIILPTKASKEELGLTKPNDLHIINFFFTKLKECVINSITCVVSKLKFAYKYCKRTLISLIFKSPVKEELLPTKIDLSRCADVLQKNNLKQRCVQYQVSDNQHALSKNGGQADNTKELSTYLSNNSFILDENNNFLDATEKKNDNIINSAINKQMEEVVFINFKDQTMHVEQVVQDELNYGSISLTNTKRSNSQRKNKIEEKFGTGSNFKKSSKFESFDEYDPTVEILKMKGKPRPGHLFTNKTVWHVKKETEMLKLDILENQRREEMAKYNQKVFALKQQRQLLGNRHNELLTTSAGIQSIKSNQSNSFLIVEKNLEDEVQQLNLTYQRQQAEIKATIEICNEEIKSHQQEQRDKKMRSQEEIQNKKTGRLERTSINSGFSNRNRLSSSSVGKIDTDDFAGITYNFYRIDSVELFFKELRNAVLIFTSNILTLIGEVLIFSIYLIYVPNHENLFTPTVNYFGDKSFYVFALMVIVPFTLTNFFIHLFVFFWSNLRQEYLFLNKISEFELLWGIDDAIMNQLNSDRHLQNLDNTNMDGIFNDNTSKNELTPLLGYENKTYNPFKWLRNKFSSTDGEYGHADSKLYTHFTNYNGFQINGPNGSNANVHSSLTANNDNRHNDFYQNIIDKLQPNLDIDPLQQTNSTMSNGGLKQFSMLQNDSEVSGRGFENSRRNLSIMSAHDIRMLDKVSLIKSNLTIKEILIVLVHRLKKFVICWRLKSESALFVIGVLFAFGFACFAAGVVMTLTDVFLYFDHE